MARSDTQVRTVAVGDLSVDEVLEWCGAVEGERTSLYLPTHRSGPDVVQDHLRFRNLIGRAEAELSDRHLLDAARTLVDDTSFWAHGSDGLVVLVDANGTVAIRLPEAPAEVAVVSDRFHLKPLLAQLARVQRFHVLALSRGKVRMVRVLGDHVAEVEVPDLPESLADALGWDDRERQVQRHATGPVSGGRVSVASHGHGDAGDALDADMERFLHLVDAAVVRHRGDTTLPLVLAGVDEVVASFRRLTKCRHLVEQHVGGNPDRTPAAGLADAARELVGPGSAQSEDRARNAFLGGHGVTVDTVEQAVLAAVAGQVASIFVPSDLEVWGRYRPGHTGISEHEERQPGEHDLADVAATETLRHGGAAHIVPAADIPGGGTAAATFRR